MSLKKKQPGHVSEVFVASNSCFICGSFTSSSRVIWILGEWSWLWSVYGRFIAGLSDVSWVENTWTISMMFSDTILLMDCSPVILLTWGCWWLTYPSEKWWSESQLGWWFFPTEWKVIIHSCSKPATIYIYIISLYIIGYSDNYIYIVIIIYIYMYTSSLYKPWCFQGQSMGFCWATGSLSHTMNGKSLHEMMTSPNWAYLAWSCLICQCGNMLRWKNLIPTSKNLERFLGISLIVFWDIIGLAMDGIL